MYGGGCCICQPGLFFVHNSLCVFPLSLRFIIRFSRLSRRCANCLVLPQDLHEWATHQCVTSLFHAACFLGNPFISGRKAPQNPDKVTSHRVFLRTNQSMDRTRVHPPTDQSHLWQFTQKVRWQEAGLGLIRVVMSVSRTAWWSKCVLKHVISQTSIHP